MKEVHLFYAPDVESTLELPSDEATHAVRVLRMQAGDEIVVTDGKGYFYECVIASTSTKHCSVEIVTKTCGEELWRGKIQLAVAPTKNNDRMEWFAEKATEIGINDIHFVCCANSERKVVKTERFEKIVMAATKQSHKAFLPQVHDMQPFKAFIKQPFEGQKFIAHCYDDVPETDNAKPFLADVLQTDGQTLVMIGPEGDFSIEEVQMAIKAGFQPINLGRSRLRTETAALVAVHLMYLAKRNK